MTLRWCPDPAPADWLVQSTMPWGQLVEFGPGGFAAYARLRYVPDRGGAELPEDHPTDLAQARWALQRLAGFTATPDDCWFCVWEGYSDLPLPAGATEDTLVTLPHRRFALFRGSLADLDDWERDVGSGSAWAPAFAWPADQRWCFASDVDPDWAGIGAEPAAIDALLADNRLDVVRARPDEGDYQA